MNCPYCGAGSPYNISTRITFKCRKCLRQFSETSHGFFRCSKLSREQRDKFLELVGTTSARQIGFAMGVEYKTAWNLCRKWAAEQNEAKT